MRNALQDVREVLEGADRPLTTSEVVDELHGEHDRAAVEHLLRHFEHERLVAPAADGGWGWVSPQRAG